MTAYTCKSCHEVSYSADPYSTKPCPYCGEEIEKDENELPTIFDLKGIAPNATGGMSSEDFVASLRYEKK